MIPKWVLNTPFLVAWLPILSCKFLLLLNVTNGLFWNASHNSGFIWRILQRLFIIWRIVWSFLLYVRQGMLSFFLSKSFRSVLSTLSIRSLKLISSYPLSMNFCFSINQCFLYSVSVEQIVLILIAFLYDMLFLSGFGWSECA